MILVISILFILFLVFIYTESENLTKVKGSAQSKYGDEYADAIQHNVIQQSQTATQMSTGTLPFWELRITLEEPQVKRFIDKPCS